MDVEADVVEEVAEEVETGGRGARVAEEEVGFEEEEDAALRNSGGGSWRDERTKRVFVQGWLRGSTHFRSGMDARHELGVLSSSV